MNSEHKLETKLGTIFLKPTSATHIYADANHHCLSPHAPDHHPPLTVNGCQISASIHFHKHPNGEWGIGPEVGDWSAKYYALTVSKVSARSSDVSQAARRKITEVLVPAVNDWVLSHPHLIVAAADEDHARRLADQQKKVDGLRSQLKEAEAELAVIEAGGQCC